MTIKSYFADSVADAIRAARTELGEDALLLKTQRTPEQWRNRGKYEVVLGVGPVRQEAPSVPGPQTVIAWPQKTADATAALRQAGISTAAISLLTAGAERRVRDGYSTGIEDALVEEAVSRFQGNSDLGNARAPWRLALVGPPGSGKTLMAVRLIVQYGLAKKRRVRVISACDSRVGGTARLRCYTRLLDVDHQTVETAEQLATMLGEKDSTGLTLIDTPGLTASDSQAASVLAAVLVDDPTVCTHLTLSATMTAEDMTAVAKRFTPFGVDRLIFTRLDETHSMGALLSLMAASGKPASFFGSGQEAPGDLSPGESLNIRRLFEGYRETTTELAV